MKHHVAKVSLSPPTRPRDQTACQSRSNNSVGACKCQDWTAAMQHWPVCNRRLSHHYCESRSQLLVWSSSSALVTMRLRVCYSYTGYQHAGMSSSNSAASCTQFSMGMSSVSDKHCWVHRCQPDTFRASISVTDGCNAATAAYKVRWKSVLAGQSWCMECTAWRFMHCGRIGKVQKTVEHFRF